MAVRIKLDELISQKYNGMGHMRGLSTMLNIRYNTLLDYNKGNKLSLSNEHLEQIAKFFEITDFNELLEFMNSENEKTKNN